MPLSVSREPRPHRGNHGHGHRGDSRRGTRDTAEISRRLARWLAAVPPEGGPAPEVRLGTESAGQGGRGSSVPVRVEWPRTGRADYVMRLAPAPADVAAFPTYFLQDQFEAMRLVGELTSVPVPTVRWLEPSGRILGRPFFLMNAVSGQAPGKRPPYNLGGWLSAAPAGDQRRLQEASVAVLAQLHQIPEAHDRFGFLLPRFEKDTPLRRHLAWTWDWYWFAAGDLDRSPLVERVLAWLEEHCPAETEDPVLCWGDARIGNILYRDFTPSGVLGWEMATLGPRQLDLAGMIIAHRVLEHLAAARGRRGMPGFLKQADVVASYERRTGRQVGDLTWCLLYASVQHAVAFLRAGTGQVRSGKRAMPSDVEDLIGHRSLLEDLARDAGALSGTTFA